MPRWVHERRQDHYYKKAKEEGYRSRASYKLKQLNQEYRFFDKATSVLDLGAAPGGWLQVAAEFMNEGLILGVDIKEIQPLEANNVETVVGDVTDLAIQAEILERFGGKKADVILSDMAPNVTGIWEVDDLRQIHLARIALVIADKLLKADGWMVVKVFMGPEHEAFIRDINAFFERVYIVKPRASRKGSAEVYIVAKNMKTDRVLPEELREGTIVKSEEKMKEGPLPGENLPEYGEPEEYKPRKH